MNLVSMDADQELQRLGESSFRAVAAIDEGR
jgi:hypothetical protein